MIALIAAYSRNKVIGNKGCIPWKIKGEQRRFRELTLDNTVIMGRKTFEEIGKPLSGRHTVVISSSAVYESENCMTVRTLEDAMRFAKTEKVFIAGGERLYKETLDMADYLYITEIDGEIEGDTYFPGFNESSFTKTVEPWVEEKLRYRYVTYTRVKTIKT